MSLGRLQALHFRAGFRATTAPFRRTMATSNTPVEDFIREKVTSALNPTKLEIRNDSAHHAHHAPMQGSTSTETHFQLVAPPTLPSLAPLLKPQQETNRSPEQNQCNNNILSIRLQTPTSSPQDDLRTTKGRDGSRRGDTCSAT
ncbi:hypothetical protein FQN54_003869 [Arachnomyces sp. PD_36]|nr:hypothetical protein FQN54_003869 [Arachnomyces sp. PD_36]